MTVARRGRRGCCPACLRDSDLLRRNPERISEFIEIIGEVMHGHDPRTQRSIEHRAGRMAPREQHYVSCYTMSPR